MHRTTVAPRCSQVVRRKTAAKARIAGQKNNAQDGAEKQDFRDRFTRCAWRALRRECRIRFACDPRDGQAAFLMGRLETRRGHHAEAAGWFERAARVRDDEKSWHAVGRSEYKAWEANPVSSHERLRNAAEAYSHALSRTPPDSLRGLWNLPRTLYELGRVYESYGAFEGALAVYQHIATALPFYPEFAAVAFRAAVVMRHLASVAAAPAVTTAAPAVTTAEAAHAGVAAAAAATASNDAKTAGAAGPTEAVAGEAVKQPAAAPPAATARPDVAAALTLTAVQYLDLSIQETARRRRAADPMVVFLYAELCGALGTVAGARRAAVAYAQAFAATNRGKYWLRGGGSGIDGEDGGDGGDKGSAEGNTSGGVKSTSGSGGGGSDDDSGRGGSDGGAGARASDGSGRGSVPTSVTEVENGGAAHGGNGSNLKKSTESKAEWVANGGDKNSGGANGASAGGDGGETGVSEPAGHTTWQEWVVDPKTHHAVAKEWTHRREPALAAAAFERSRGLAAAAGRTLADVMTYDDLVVAAEAFASFQGFGKATEVAAMALQQRPYEGPARKLAAVVGGVGRREEQRRQEEVAQYLQWRWRTRPWAGPWYRRYLAEAVGSWEAKLRRDHWDGEARRHLA
ncbi:unnamed protein product, partial [Phaeothamnion confervicola]